MDAFLFFTVKLLEVYHAEIIDDINDHLIKFEELFRKEIAFVHLVTDNCTAGMSFTNFI